jgi:hypothetical protein
MFDNRPAYLTADPAYGRLPATPLALDLDPVPDWIKLSLLHLGGIQPVTGTMAAAAGGRLQDAPSEAEIEMFRAAGTRFQILMVVISVAAFRTIDEVSVGTPYAVSLVPADKRGVVSEVDIDYVRQIDLEAYREARQPVFLNLNPFTGAWGLWGDAALLDPPRAGWPDGVGLVTDMYYLQRNFDPDDVLMVDLGVPLGRASRRYRRHRSRKLYTPFEELQARRIWGADSPIELFLLQGLLREGLSPQLQMLLYDDGSAYPSFYDLMAAELAEEPGLITEADMYFPEPRVAVFCDSRQHHRGQRAVERDAAIDVRLRAIGVTPVRVSGRTIVQDLGAAVRSVLDAVG